MASEDEASTSSAAGRRLSRELIVRSAVTAIDREGLHQLTMRSLGRDLGVEAMALYRYVTGREDLLEAVVDQLLDGLHRTVDSRLADSWQGYLQSLAHAVRDVAVQHPAAFPLVATRHPAAPWLRPPLRSLELVDHFLATLERFGFEEEQVVAAYRSFSSFLLGHLLLEASIRGAETAPAEEAVDEGGASIPNQDGQVDLQSAPTVARYRDLLSEDHSREEFETSLESLLDRMEMTLSR